LNPNVVGTCISVEDDPSKFLFDTPILGANVNEGLFLVEFFFSHCCAMNLNDDVGSHLLQWWNENVKLYPNVAFLVIYIFTIPGLQIKSKKKLLVARVLISLCHCRLGLTIHQDLFVVPCLMEVPMARLIFGQNEQMNLPHSYFPECNTSKANHSSYSNHKVQC
jgi:hypothetical protein